MSRGARGFFSLRASNTGQQQKHNRLCHSKNRTNSSETRKLIPTLCDSKMTLVKIRRKFALLPQALERNTQVTKPLRQENQERMGTMAIFTTLLLGKRSNCKHSNYEETTTNYKRKIVYSYIQLSPPAKGFAQSLKYSLFHVVLKIMLFWTPFTLHLVIQYQPSTILNLSLQYEERFHVVGHYGRCLDDGVEAFEKSAPWSKLSFERFHTWVSSRSETQVILEYYSSNTEYYSSNTLKLANLRRILTRVILQSQRVRINFLVSE